jgi:hypothetical protein
MSLLASNTYIDAKARIARALGRVATFVKASDEYVKDQENLSKRAKVVQMLAELNEIRRCVESDIQLMETAVGQGTAPSTITDNSCSTSLIDSFDTMYYDLAALASIHSMSLSSKADLSISNITSGNSSSGFNNLSMFQLPKRKFPTFSGNIIEWQGFEDLFQSILSHAPDLPDVERFEYLKTSLEGEALSLISHLALTAANYSSAWDILRARYGNKRDLARIHFDALVAPQIVKCNDAQSIKNVINTILEHTAALDNLQFVTRQWSPLLVYMFEKHLDYELRARWEQTIGDNHNPQITEFVDFLRSYVRSAEVHQCRSGSYVQNSKPVKSIKSHQSSPAHFRSTTSHRVLTTTTSQPPATKCPLCQVTHSIRQCPLFRGKTPNERFQIAKDHNLCINCLGAGHASVNCPSKYKCQTCQKSHHSMLHFFSVPKVVQSSSNKSSEIQANTASLVVRGQPHHTVLLSTVLVNICATDGRVHSCRALLDSGSQASFITDKAASTLMLPRQQSSTHISTFASSTSTLVRGKTTFSITPRGEKLPSFSVDALIVKEITGMVPQTPVLAGSWEHIRPLPLADPFYNIPNPVDLLLGADILPLLILSGQRAGKEGEPIAMETVFGWVLMGPIGSEIPLEIKSLCVSVSENLDKTLKQFWELEELPSIRHLSPEDTAAEKIYQTTTVRLESGRFMVRIPFRTPRPILGNSKSSALQRYKALEARLSRDENLCKQYRDFMQDYLDAGHMELVPPAELDTPLNYYIPHHCVLRPDSSTTKLRVVFNASARTSFGISLNDLMYTGPKLQPEIQIVLLCARLWKHVFTADVKQMYRQIMVHPDDRDYLRIFWRFSPTTPIDEYRLCTVTYGTSSAPFQALRTVRELATKNGASLPLAAGVLLNDTFVDDVFTGANTEEDVLECQSQLIKLLSLGQFELRKWASNTTKILKAVPEDARAMSPSVLFDNSEHPELKVLGLKWDPSTDSFSFKAQPSSNSPTKRSVLSDIARVFDPLGLLSPITFWTKHLMQLLWTSGIAWDDPIPETFIASWRRYQLELQHIQGISIPRRLTQDCALCLQLHAFSDSSEKGYAAAIYLRVETPTSVHCQLVMGKSKVAPLKRTTIPRLELCGAVLAAKLLRYVTTAYQNRNAINTLYAWTDSTTALAWIRSSPHRWATFVANRTSQIQELTSPSIWHYVPTQVNPVDCASRGLFPSELATHSLWWTGPPFLLESPENWPTLPGTHHDISEILPESEERQQTVLSVQVNHSIMELLDRISSLDKILRITVYCLRFSTLRRSQTLSNVISADEMASALATIIHSVQRLVFLEEITLMAKGLQCSKHLRRLDPFLDEAGLIRVGGRLKNADLPYSQKHPLLLPSRHRLTTLIIDYHHNRLKHPGASALQAQLQRDYWILSARKAIRSRLRLCIACFRTNPRSIQPKMANLPKYRVQQTKPFSISGVDYAGPLSVKGNRGRRSVTTQVYICLFVCTTTKALHLELSSDLSTETFLLAFTRFVARRGPVKEIHSDCGTNFIGAARLLTSLHKFTHSDTYQSRIQQYLSSKQISWHFNPPSSPHFGGLWEAGVKSTKALILRSIGSHKLTSEELNTLLTQIEATLNSRPLCALSNDPADTEALTPSHFLTLEPSISLPDPCLEAIPLSKLERWRLINDLHRHFWTRWTNEYLVSLQLRTKWSTDKDTLHVGDLVVIKEASPPLQWRLARIQTLHPGQDGINRVATVNTASGTYIRPVVKLCPLPVS